MPLGGGKVGEAWIGIHARGASTEREIKRIAEADAKDIAESFDKEWDKQTRRRFAGDRGLLARAFDEEDIGPLVKRFGNLQTALRQVREERDRMNDTGEMSLRSYIRSGTALAVMEKKFKESEFEANRFHGTLEKTAIRLREIERTDLAKTLSAGTFAKNVKDLETLDATTNRYLTTLRELQDENRITNVEFEKHRALLGDIDARTRENILTLEREEEVRRRHKEILQAHTEALKMDEKWNRERGKAVALAAKEQDHFNEVLAKTRRALRDRQDTDIAKFLLGTPSSWKEIENRYKGVDDAQSVLIARLRELSDQGQITSEDYARATKRINEAASGMDRTHDSALGRMLERYSRFDTKFRKTTISIENSVGRAFGRGSRNDFVNLIGGMFRGGAMLVTGPLRYLSGIGASLADVTDKFQLLRSQGVNPLSAGFRSLGPVLGAVIGPLVSLGVALGAVSFFLPAIVSGITMIAGSLFSLVGVIATGLMGAIVAALPVVAALGVALGGIVIVAARIADRSEEMGKKFSKFGDIFEKLKKQSDPVINDLLEQVLRLDDEFESLGGVAIRAVEGMAGGFKRFVDNIKDPAMDKFLSAWGQAVPRIVGSLSDGIADFGTGLITWLTPALPYAERLASAFGRTMDNFSSWAASDAGQKKIASWLETAWDAASRLSGAFGEASSALFGMFSSATEGASGQGFLDWIERITTKWNEWVNSPDGQGQMAAFWSDVEDFGATAYQTWQDLRDTWNSLDTESARDNFNTIVEATGSILSAIEAMAPGLEAVGKVAVGVFGEDGPVVKGVKAIEDAINFMKDLEDIMKPGPTDRELNRQRARDLGGSQANEGLNIGLNARFEGATPFQQETVSEWYNQARKVGEAIATSMNTGTLIGFGARNPVDLGYILGKDAEAFLVDAGRTGVALADALRENLRTGVTKIPEDVGPSLSDAQKQMLASAGLEPDEIIRLSRIQEGMAAWQGMLVDDMTAGAQKGTSAFGAAFGAGMSGFTSESQLEMFANGALLGQGIIDGFGSITPQAATAAQSLGTSVDIGLDTGLSQVAMTTAARMAEGVAGITLGANNMGAALFSRLSQTPQEAAMAMAGLPGEIAAKMSAATAVATTGASQIVTKGSAIGSMVPLAGSAIAALSGAIAGKMAQGSSAAATGASNIRSSGSNIGGMVSGAASAISGLAGAIGAKMSAAWSTASAWAAKIRAIFASVQSANAGVSIGLPRTAAGGVFYGASTRVIGEAGMEAVVPLNRNLATVDPAVRALSAFAQGKYNTGGERSLVISEGAIQVTTRVADPVLVAESMLDRLVGNVVPG